MEKIYMENNQKKQKKNMWQSKSVIGTFALAIIALVAMVVVGVGQVSYAIPEIVDKFPDTFTTAEPGETILGTNGGNVSFPVLPYKTTDNLVVFCMEHHVDFMSDTTFTKGDAIQDYGLLYLMAHIYPHQTFKTANGTELAEPVQVWLSQVAIWLYLAEMYPDNAKYSLAVGSTLTAEEALNVIKNTRGIYTQTDSNYYKADGTSALDISANDATFYDTYLLPLLNTAKANKNIPNKELKISMDSLVDKTSDGAYYQSSEITVLASPSENFNGYDLELTQAPEGTKVVDVNGNEITKLTDLQATDKFYIRVPADKVTDENKVIKFRVIGSFTTYEGNYYVAAGAQTIASVDTVTNNKDVGSEFTIDYTPDIPDTGISAAQTVYFIGLIVLLSGVGIIYANVKPTEQK